MANKGTATFHYSLGNMSTDPAIASIKDQIAEAMDLLAKLPESVANSFADQFLSLFVSSNFQLVECRDSTAGDTCHGRFFLHVLGVDELMAATRKAANLD